MFFAVLLSQFSTDFDAILQGVFSYHGSDYREIFIGKYFIAEKLDHLACNVIQG